MAIDGFFLTGAVLELFCNLEKPLQKQPFPCIHLLLFVILEQNDKKKCFYQILSNFRKLENNIQPFSITKTAFSLSLLHIFFNFDKIAKSYPENRTPKIRK